MKLEHVETIIEGQHHQFVFKDENDNEIIYNLDYDYNTLWVNGESNFVSKRIITNPNKDKAKQAIIRYFKTYEVYGLKEQ